MPILGLDHVQVAIPPGGEDEARRFWGAGVGLPEVTKPAVLAGRGGVWFQAGAQQVHCGIEEPVARSRRHPALLSDDLDALRARLEGAASRSGSSQSSRATGGSSARTLSATESSSWSEHPARRVGALLCAARPWRSLSSRQ